MVAIKDYNEKVKIATTVEKKKTVVDVEKLNLWFAENHVLKDVSLSFHDKKITAIIGPSGCGKSTLLRCFNRMNDLIETTKIEGKITIDNKDIHSPGIDVCNLRSKVGMVFQKPNPFPKSIYENVAYGLKIKGIRKKSRIMERVEKSLQQAWLWNEVKDRLYSSAFSLSGGQQQRLCMARALATEPEILLLDEPTSALDPQSTNKIEDLLLELKEKVTLFIVTHNIGQAGRVSDYTLLMYLGEIVEYGKTKQVFTVPKEKRTEDYITGRFG